MATVERGNPLVIGCEFLPSDNLLSRPIHSYECIVRVASIFIMLWFWPVSINLRFYSLQISNLCAPIQSHNRPSAAPTRISLTWTLREGTTTKEQKVVEVCGGSGLSIDKYKQTRIERESWHIGRDQAGGSAYCRRCRHCRQEGMFSFCLASSVSM